MNAAEVITSILTNEGITAAQLAKEIGLSRPQVIYDILNGKIKTITAKMADKIKTAKPIYNRTWLVSGVGQMLDVDGIDEVRTPAVPTDSMTIINRLIDINAQKDEELRELRLQLAHLTECFQKLADRFNDNANNEKVAL